MQRRGFSRSCILLDREQSLKHANNTRFEKKNVLNIFNKFARETELSGYKKLEKNGTKITDISTLKKRMLYSEYLIKLKETIENYVKTNQSQELIELLDDYKYFLPEMLRKNEFVDLSKIINLAFERKVPIELLNKLYEITKEPKAA